MNLQTLNDVAKKVPVFMADSSSPLSGKTGLTVAVRVSKNGAAFAAGAGSVAELEGGHYAYTLGAADVNALGPLVVKATATGAVDFAASYRVVAFDPYDAVRLGLTAMPNAAANANGGLPVLSVSGTTLGYTVSTLTNLPTMPTDWLTAAGLSAGAVTEIQTGLATASALASVASNVVTIGTYVDSEIAQIIATQATHTSTLAALPTSCYTTFWADSAGHLYDGTAAAGSATGLTLQAGTDVFDRTGYQIELVSGPGRGKFARVASSAGLVLAVETNGVEGWGPDGDDPTLATTYRFEGAASVDAASIADAVGAKSTVGAADNTIAGQLRAEDNAFRAGSTTTNVVLAATAPAVDLSSPSQAYVITSGALAGKVFRFTSYNTTTKAGNVTPAFPTAGPAAGAGYKAVGLASMVLAPDGLDYATIETGLSARQWMQAVGGPLVGVLTAPTATTRVYAAAGAPGTPRVTATIDLATGLRTAVTLTPGA